MAEEGIVRRRLPVLAMMFFAISPAWAQSPPPDQAEQIRILLERVQQLEKRVGELETKPTATASAAVTAANVPAAAKPETAAAAPPPGPGPGHQHEIAEPQAATERLEVHYPSLQIRGFGDVDFAATDQKGTTSGFDLGQLDLHLASALSRKVTYFGELTFNAHPANFTVEVERSIIRYDYNDFFKLSFGRYHTPIGYWNTAFHHGAWLQTTIARPDFVKFGGTFIPVHFLGLLAEGNIPSGGAGLSWDFGVGNGRDSDISRPGDGGAHLGDSGDINNNRAWVANLYSRPAKLYGLQMGVSVYRDKITLPTPTPAGNDFREWISAAHIVWTKESPEFLAEFANVNHRSILTNAVTNNQAYYVQVGYRLPWLEKTLKPYYRFEHTHTPLSENVFLNQDLVQSIAGMRYDITNYAAFKGEYRHFKRLPTEPPVNGAFFQTDFTF